MVDGTMCVLRVPLEGCGQRGRKSPSDLIDDWHCLDLVRALRFPTACSAGGQSLERDKADSH
jgi:hypothetical protein